MDIQTAPDGGLDEHQSALGVAFVATGVFTTGIGWGFESAEEAL